jgi:hypothetical protein
LCHCEERSGPERGEGTWSEIPHFVRNRLRNPDFNIEIAALPAVARNDCVALLHAFVEESVPVSVIEQECGVSSETVARWVSDCRRACEAGFSPHRAGKGRSLPLEIQGHFRPFMDMAILKQVSLSDTSIARR